MTARRITLLALCLFSVTALAQTASAQTGVSKGSQALIGGTIYTDPGAKPIVNGVVVIQDGLIVAVGRKGSVKVPKGMTVLDCSGATVTAGFWNSHVHFHQRKWSDAGAVAAGDLDKQLQLMLTRYGFTSVFDTWSNFANTKRIRERVESGEVAGPRIRATGEALMPKRGVPVQFALNQLGFGPVEIVGITDSAEAHTATNKLLDGGADGIKIYAQTFAPRVAMPEDAIQIVVSETHKRGKLVFAHPTSNELLLASVLAGVDVIVHTTPQSSVWDTSILTPMKAKGVALIPTLKLWKWETRHNSFSSQERFVGVAVGQLRAWVGVGGTVLFGTDIGYIDDYDTTEEFSLMAKAGMDYRQILASLTTAPAERFGDSQRLGKIASGMIADLVVMQGDPAKDVRAFASVRHTLRDGRIIYTAE